MILTFCIVLVLTPVSLVRSDDAPTLQGNKTVKTEILERINAITTLLGEFEKSERQREEQLRTTGIWVVWNPSKKGLPVGFVTGGTDNYGWYGVVIRAKYNDDVIPGKYNPDAHSAYVSSNGRDIRIDGDFEILTHNNYVWTRKYLKNDEALIEGGQENGRKTYICRTRHTDEWVCGKLIDGVCKVPYGGREYVYDNWLALELRND